MNSFKGRIIKVMRAVCVPGVRDLNEYVEVFSVSNQVPIKLNKLTNIRENG